MTTHTCPRCDGTGRISEYNYIRDGLCFKCNGTGKLNRKPTTCKVTEPNPQIRINNERRTEIAKELYKNDARLTVPTTHEYYWMHAIQLAKKDGIWETL